MLVYIKEILANLTWSLFRYDGGDEFLAKQPLVS